MKKIVKQLIENPFYLMCYAVTLLIVLLILNYLEVFDWLFLLLSKTKPLLLGCLFPFFLEPCIQKMPFTRKNNVILFYLLCILVIVLIIIILLPGSIQLGNEITDKATSTIVSWQKEFADKIDQDFLIEGGNKIIQFLSVHSLDSLRNITSTFTTLAFATGFGFLLSLELDSISNEFKKIVSNHEKFDQFYVQFSTLVLQYFKGLILDSIFLLVFISLFLKILNISHAIYFAVLICILNLFPYVGAILGSAICLIYVFFTSSQQVFICLIGLFTIQQIESMLVHPLIFSHTMKVHPLHLLAAVLIYEFIFGIAGLILSPLLAMFQQIALTSYLKVLDESKIGGWEEL